MKNDEMMWKFKKMMRMQQIFVLESMAVSLFAMVLIFGLGFIFPSINPYIVIKWIVYITGVYFLFAVVGNWVRRAMMMRMMKKMGWDVKAKVSKKK
ncbi:MAG TPA: hypothetical protein VKC53_04410 [Patescibacteria group bacterium]|nr:hypothetical protein [Patescibacteria group bacterium]